MAHHGYIFGLNSSTMLSDSIDARYILGTGIAGEIAGFKLARMKNISIGQAEMFNHIMISSEFYGGLAVSIIFMDASNHLDYVWAGVLLGEISGFTGWYLLGRDDYTIGDALTYDTYAGVSLLTSIALTSLYPNYPNSIDERIYPLTILLVHPSANYLGLKIFRNNGIPFTGGLAVIGGTIGGALMGRGIANLLNWTTYREISWAQAIGGWAGFIPTYIMAKNMGYSEKTGFLIKPGIRFTEGEPEYRVDIFKTF